MKSIDIPTTLDTVWAYVQDHYAPESVDDLHNQLVSTGNQVVKHQHQWQKPDDWLAYTSWRVAEDDEKEQLAHLFIQAVGQDQDSASQK
ncbi:MAG: hypothetical protein OWR62_10805 [Sulfobacillus thermotolerans]|nr:hypothetical protein [Sulfobacillus thermotolerans]